MNLSSFYAAWLIVSTAGLEPQKPSPQPRPPAPPTPPPVAKAETPASSPEKYVYEQKPLGGRGYLVAPDQAQAIINRFKEAYPKLGSPRILIYVNRELIDENSGMKLSARKVQTETVRGDHPPKSAATNASGVTASGPSERITAQNTYRFRDRASAPLADRQTVRDIERLFGRPLRLAGAALVDQQIAAQLLPGKPVDALQSTENEQARRDREALSKVADVVIEVLMSSRNVTVPELSGEKTYSVPDLQATAIRLSDARIIGQATASDIVGAGRSAGRVARFHDVREITEATVLSLMEDIVMTQ